MTKEVGIQLSLEGQQKLIDGIKDVGKHLDDMAKKSVAGAAEGFSSLGGKASGALIDGLKNVVKSAEEAAIKIAKVGLVAGTALGIGAVTGAVKLAAGFDDAMAQLQVMTGVTDRNSQAFKDMEKAAQEVGKATKFSSKEAAEGMAELAAQGFSAKEAITAIPSVANVAAINNVSLAEASSTAAVAMNAFGLQAKDVSKIMDIQTAAANMGVLKFSDFKAAMAAGGSVANLAGQSITGYTSALVALTNTGQSAADSGTSMKAALMQLISPGKEAQTSIDKLGLSVRDAQGNMRPWADIIGQVEKATKNMTKEDRDFYLANLGGSDGIRAYAASLNAKIDVERNGVKTTLTGSEALKEMERQLQNSGGAADKNAAILRDTFSAQLDNLKGSLEEAGITVGKSLLPALKDIVVKLQPVINKFIDWESKTHTIGNALTGVIKNVSDFIQSLAPMAGKILGIIQSINPLGAGLNIFKGFIEGGAAGGIDAAADVGKRIGSAFGLNLNSGIEGAANFLKTQLIPVFDEIGKAIGPAISKIGDFIGSIAAIVSKSGLFKTVGDIVTGVIKTIGDVFAILTKAFNDNKETITNTLATVGNVFKEVFSAAGDIVKFFAKLIGDNMPLISRIIDTVATNIRAMITVAIQIFNNLKPAIEAILPVALTLVNFFEEVFGKTIVGIGIIIEGLTRIFSRIPEAIDTVKQAFYIIGYYAKEVWDGISQAVGLAWRIMANIFDQIIFFISNTWNSAWDGVSRVVKGAFRIVQRIIGGAANVLIKIINGILWAINKGIDAANVVGGIFGQHIGSVDYVPEINLDAMASGGRARGGRTLVGEKGPEIVDLEKGAMVYPNWMTSQMMQPPAAQTVVNNNQQYSYGGPQWNMGVQTNNSPDAVMQSYALMRAMAGGSAV